MQSPEINELAKALAKAQAQIENAVKHQKNPYYKSKYADLPAIWEACRKPLTDNGLSVIQSTRVENNTVILVTTLLHVSGQWVRGEYPVEPQKKDPQGYGSALTYARRYTLQSLVGVASEDDDGEAAMDREKGAAPKEHKPEGKGKVKVTNAHMEEKPTEEQLDMLAEIIHSSGWSSQDIRDYTKRLWNIETSHQLQLWQYNKLTNHLLSNPRISESDFSDVEKLPFEK